MPPCISNSTSIAANAQNDNIISGNLFEFVEEDSLLSVGLSQAATGVLVTVSASERVLARDLVPVVKGTTPIKPDDFMVQSEPVLAGERLVIAARNTTGAPIVLLAVICIDEA